MWYDVESPLLESSYFALCFTDDYLDDCAFQPCSLCGELIPLVCQQLPGFTVTRHSQGCLTGQDFLLDGSQLDLPPRHDQLMHPGAGDFVYTDQQRFSRFPAGGGMLHKIVGKLLQAIVGGDDFIILAQQLFQQCRLILIQVRLLYGFGDPVVQVQPGDAQLLSPGSRKPV